MHTAIKQESEKEYKNDKVATVKPYEAETMPMSAEVDRFGDYAATHVG
jgi:hypothetical protein